MANRNPNRKGLMPAWKPGQSGNPSGRPRHKPVSGRYEFMCEVPLPESIRKKLGLRGRRDLWQGRDSHGGGAGVATGRSERDPDAACPSPPQLISTSAASLQRKFHASEALSL